MGCGRSLPAVAIGTPLATMPQNPWYSAIRDRESISACYMSVSVEWEGSLARSSKSTLGGCRPCNEMRASTVVRRGHVLGKWAAGAPSRRWPSELRSPLCHKRRGTRLSAIASRSVRAICRFRLNGKGASHARANAPRRVPSVQCDALEHHGEHGPRAGQMGCGRSLPAVAIGTPLATVPQKAWYSAIRDRESISACYM